MSRDEHARSLAQALIWVSVAGAYVGCLSPIWLDGWGLGDDRRRLRHDHLVPYGLTRFRPYQPRLEKRVSFVLGWFLPP
ncbi:MAG: hypothetical protein ABSC03_04235 [Verrucomicrobiota bacterium]|jgi:hypothetical protein